MKIIIAGAGEVGSHLAKMLSNEANEITVIDQDGERLEMLRSHMDVLTVEGNPSAIHVLHEAEVETADLFIAVSPSESQDVNIAALVFCGKFNARNDFDLNSLCGPVLSSFQGFFDSFYTVMVC